jgi:hypothetical protein
MTFPSVDTYYTTEASRQLASESRIADRVAERLEAKLAPTAEPKKEAARRPTIVATSFDPKCQAEVTRERSVPTKKQDAPKPQPASRGKTKEETMKTNTAKRTTEFDRKLTAFLQSQVDEIEAWAVKNGKPKPASPASTAPSTRREYDPRSLDVRMGLASPATAIRHEGTRLVTGTMTPEQARRILAARAGR